MKGALDAAIDGISRATPLLMAAFVLLAIPQSARYMVNLKRALHAYDDQVPAKSGWTFKKLQPHILIRMLAAFLALAPLAMEAFLFITPTLDAKAHPIVQQARLTIPPLFLALSFWLTMFSACYRVAVRKGYLRRAVGRSLHTDERQAGGACTADLLTREPKWHARRFLLWAIVALAYAWIYTRMVYHEILDGRLTMLLVGLNASTVALNGLRGPLVLRQHSSFRGMIIVTWGYLAVCFLPGIIAAVVDSFSEAKTKAPKAEPASSSGQDGWMKPIVSALTTWSDAFDKDLPIAQFMCIIAPFIWAFCLIIPAQMILLGARFDLGELTVPDADEADAALVQSTVVRRERFEAQAALRAERNGTQSETTERTALLDEKLPLMPENKITVEDRLGRIPILMESIALPNSAFALRTLPTFRSGFLALLICWLSGLIAVLSVDELPAATFPLSSTGMHKALERWAESVGFVAVISILSIIVVPVAMLIAAWQHGQARGGAKGLWKYSEKWEKPGYVRADLADAQVEEA
ncbi:hypothetical protein IE81DRAFT_320540 [Ceraceosorus guamensis]|uniref:Uncharacterized protein n=1 Tax=Ceraceosorus guamensis TaxID=1522189 RepID=A0A316WAF9_9BASI|nr:hypothetical protein IE81DRAFT_320540 [Ceraceosorus guamensis]PWN44953.1 hypothetical protein IE81DRAFT_320540 [Ceraceosorus guamensis]